MSEREPEPPVLDHVSITASDFAASLVFYDATLGALGLVRAAEFGDEEENDADLEAAGWGSPGSEPVVWLIVGPAPTTAAHLSLRADTKADVDAFFAAALANGGQPHDQPRRWAIYRRGEYRAVVADPDSNLLEAVGPE
jgi:catechol 2,3-dioxygenase-like lactoylglutathione lyase family enzyme